MLTWFHRDLFEKQFSDSFPPTIRCLPLYMGHPVVLSISSLRYFYCHKPVSMFRGHTPSFKLGPSLIFLSCTSKSTYTIVDKNLHAPVKSLVADNVSHYTQDRAMRFKSILLFQTLDNPVIISSLYHQEVLAHSYETTPLNILKTISAICVL